MRIKKLEIVGFKSFVDRTVLHFDQAVTAIVGPNGCGKSNVVDAIKWAMGEQSAQRLRGKAMDDIIFAGSENRGPHGFAEVSVTFDNTDGLAPPEYNEYSEIMITRRLDRQGNSDYYINRTPVRLMDITNLFLGTGVGRRAYSIIEQGRIGFIVSSKPEDRRHMIEEAAGITKFKARKKAAERKMEQTRQNLLRVSDILGELERSLASLKRQAQKAERYKNYRNEIRDLELYVASHRWLELISTERVVSGELDEATAKADGARRALKFREAEFETEREQLDSLSDEVEQGQNRAYELDNRVRMLEGQIQQQLERLDGLRERERISERELSELSGQREALRQERDALSAALEELESSAKAEADALAREDEELERRRSSAADAEQAVTAARARVNDADTRIARGETVLASFERRRQEARERLDRLRQERDEKRNRATELEQEASALEVRLEGLRSGKEQSAARKEELEQELTRLREAIRESDREVESLREELANRRSRLRSLEELQQRFEGVGAGVRALMTDYAQDEQQRGSQGLLGLVADRVECPAELTTALAGALGHQLQHVVVDRAESGLTALEFLRNEERGRATLVPRSPRRVAGARPAIPAAEGVVGCLADHVRCAPEDESLVYHLLGEVLVVESMDAALRVHREHGYEGTVVTRAGDVIRADGTLTGGAGEDTGEHMLEVKREIRELHGVVGDLESKLDAAVERHGELRNSVAQYQAELDGARNETHDAEIAIVKADKDLRASQQARQQAEERAATLDKEIEDLASTLEDADDEEKEARAEIESAQSVKQEAEQALQSAEEIHKQRRASVDEQAQHVTELRVRAAQAKQRVESDRASMDRLVRSIEELDSREERLRGDLAEGAEEQGRIRGEVMLARERLAESREEAKAAHEHLAEVRERYEAAKNALGEQEVALKNLRGHIEELNGKVNELTVRQRELSMELRHLLQHVDERHRVDVRKVITDYHAREVPDESVTDRISELQRLISRMGEINLMAIEEYEESSQRYEYLQGQQKDLEEALTQLDRAIRQMNRESRRMFREAFDQVNGRFQQIFPQLFRGGRAELKLSDPDNILETGVDIVAQPPGKKLGSLELMSGGEKALTAVALIFAIFQYKPSPFCLLDEVDAPLDEANLNRFSEAVRQMTDRSQFIVITHAKRTMEYADTLYGVTMEQPGISNLVSVELTGDRRPAPSPDEENTAVA